MKPRSRKYLLATICILSLFRCSFGQNAPGNDPPRCCYPIISEVNNSIGFIDSTGRVVIPAGLTGTQEESIEFVDSEGYFSEDLAPIETESGYGFIDQTGRIVVPPIYSQVERFSEGLAAVGVVTGQGQARTTKWGFIDAQGQVAIAPIYAGVGAFSQGLAGAAIEVGEGEAKRIWWGFIGRNGEMVIRPIYSGTSSFSEGLAAVEVLDVDGKRGNWGFIDLKGTMVIAPLYSATSDFSDGLAAVRVFPQTGETWEGKWGFINRAGQMVIAPTYSYLPTFSEGLVAIQLPRNRLGFIDTKGYVLKTQFQYSDSLPALIVSPYRKLEDDYLTPYDNALSKDFSDEPTFSDGLYPVKIRNRWGYIDKQGKMAIAPRFSNAGNFKEGLAKVGFGSRMGFINIEGKLVIPARYQYADDFSNGLTLVFFKQSFRRLKTQADETRLRTIIYGYIDKAGRTIFKGKNMFIDELQGGDTQEALDFPRQVDVNIISSPDKANVYMVPFATWDLDESILHDDKRLSGYRLSRPTEYVGPVNQQVYMVVVEFQGKKKLSRLDAHENALNKVIVHFDQETGSAKPATVQVTKPKPKKPKKPRGANRRRRKR